MKKEKQVRPDRKQKSRHSQSRKSADKSKLIKVYVPVSIELLPNIDMAAARCGEDRSRFVEGAIREKIRNMPPPLTAADKQSVQGTVLFCLSPFLATIDTVAKLNGMSREHFIAEACLQFPSDPADAMETLMMRLKKGGAR